MPLFLKSVATWQRLYFMPAADPTMVTSAKANNMGWSVIVTWRKVI
jgi:hypothetical protein